MGFWRGLMDSVRQTFQAGAAEGRQEAREALAADPTYQAYLAQAEAMRQEVAQIPKKIAPLSQREQFMTALAAPYRTLHLEIAYGGFPEIDQGRPYFWLDWQKEGGRHDLRFPLAMFAFGRAGLLPEEKKAKLAQIIRRDFQATDRTSVYQAAAPLAMYFGGGLDLYLGQEARNRKRTWERAGRPPLPDAWGAFHLCALAQLLTAAGDLGYGEKEALLACFGEGARYAQKTFPNWAGYGQALLEGEEALGSSNRRGRRVIAETIQRLTTCPASPWRLVPFASGLA